MVKSSTHLSPQRLSPHLTQSPVVSPHFSSSPNLNVSSPQHRSSTLVGENSFHESLTRTGLRYTEHEQLAPSRLSDIDANSEGAAARTALASVHLDGSSPGLSESMQRLLTHDLSPSNLHNAGDVSAATVESRTVRVRELSRVKYESGMDAFSDVTDVTDTSSMISGVEQLPERDFKPGTFLAMLEFVNRQIAKEGTETADPDTNWLDVDDMSDGSLLLSPTHSGRSSAQAASTLSPSSPLKSTNSSPATSSAPPPSPNSPRRRSGIPLRKNPSPARRPLHFSKGVSSQSAQASTHGRKQKGRKGQVSHSQKKSSGNVHAY